VQLGSTANKTVALTSNGDVYEWGETSLNKRVGTRHTKDSLAPAKVHTPEKVCKIFCSSGGEQVFAISSEGNVYSWGYDKSYQLGIHSVAHDEEKEALKLKREEEKKKKKEEEDKEEEQEKEKEVKKDDKGKKPEPPKQKKDDPKKKEKSETSESKSKKKPEKKARYIRPTEAFGIEQLKKEDSDFKIRKICGGQNHTVILDKQGNVYSWGNNKYGQLGLHSDDEVVMEPTKVHLDNVVDVSCGANHTLFLTKEGIVYACGLPKDDRFPSKHEKVNKPEKILDGLDGYNIVGISCGKKHNLLVCQSTK